MSRRKGRTHASQSKPGNTIVVPDASRPSVEQRTQATLARFEAQIFEGPLPPPEVLAEYDRISPGAASRILAMAEAQAQHRQRLEELVIRSNCRSQDRGPILGFVLALGVIGIGCYLILSGKEVSGLVALIGALAAIVVPFIYGKRYQGRELEKKREQLVSHTENDWDYSAPELAQPEGRSRSLKGPAPEP